MRWLLPVIVAATLGETSAQAARFPVPAELRTAVQFWEKIFLQYPSSQMLIYDLDTPDLLIDVIDFSKLRGKKKP